MRKKKTVTQEEVRITVVSRPLEELDLDLSDEVNELMDPVTLRLLIIPLRPSPKSCLQAVEFGSLCQQMLAVGRRVHVHPLDDTLVLTEDSVSAYYLDHHLVERRNAYLERQGHSLDDFLHYRGLTREQYQKLINFFHNRWLYRGLNLTFLSLVSAAGICGYFYGQGQKGVFFPAIHEEELNNSYLTLRAAVGSIAILNTVGLDQGLKRRGRNCAVLPMMVSPAIVASLLVFFAEFSMIEKQEKSKSPSIYFEKPESLLSMPLLWMKFCIPFLQGGLIIAGQSALRRLSLFSREERLITTYADRKPLELKPEPNLEAREARSYCGIM